MELTELVPVAAAALPLAALREELRLGTGFGDAALQDAALERAMRAGLAAVEAATGKALIARLFAWRLAAWPDPAAAALPIAPVAALGPVVSIDREGAETALGAGIFDFASDRHRPVVAARSGCLPAPPEGGALRLEFTAGFGDWAAVPPALGQAALIAAAALHDGRMGDGAGLPPPAAALVAPWRGLRLGAGR